METSEFVEGAQLSGRPRYNLRSTLSALLGPYDSPAVTRRTPRRDFRKRRSDPGQHGRASVLQHQRRASSLAIRVRVAENPTQGGFISAASRLPLRDALPRLPLGAHFQLVVASSQRDGRMTASAMAVYRGSPRGSHSARPSRIQLRNASRCRSSILRDSFSRARQSGVGLGTCTPPARGFGLARALARFVNMLTPSFVDLLDDADPEACDR